MTQNYTKNNDKTTESFQDNLFFDLILRKAS